MEELKAVMISVASDPETNQVSCYIIVQQALVQVIKLYIYYRTVSIRGHKENLWLKTKKVHDIFKKKKRDHI